MRIGLVCPYDLSLPGGVQAQVLGLAARLAALADDPLVFAPGLPDTVEGVDLGGSVSVPGNKSRVPISLDPRVSGALKEGAKDCEVLHIHEPLMPTISLLALRAGPPVVATFHAAPGRFGRGLYKALAYGFTTLLGTNTMRVTAVSSTAAAPLPPGMEVTIVPIGVDVAGMLVATERHPHRVAFLGRDESRKGLDILLEAWPMITQAVPGAELWVMGAARGTEGVHWMGRVDDQTKAEVLSSAAVYVAPNTGGESFGVVLAEAMAAGAAVVASNLPAFVEVAKDAARYFPVGDARLLARSVVELLEDQGLRQVMASRGEVRVQEFDWSRVVAAYRAEYRAALS